MTSGSFGHLSRLWVHSHVVWMWNNFLMLHIRRCHWHKTCLVERAFSKSSRSNRHFPISRSTLRKCATFIFILMLFESQFDKTRGIRVMLWTEIFGSQCLDIAIRLHITIVSYGAKPWKFTTSRIWQITWTLCFPGHHRSCGLIGHKLWALIGNSIWSNLEILCLSRLYL